MRTLYKLFVVFINHYIGKDLVLQIIGFFNRRVRFLNTVFVAYPASEEYRNAYAFEKYLAVQKWSPWLVGFFRQNGQFGLKTTVSAVEDDYLLADNSEHLKALASETERMRMLVGASQKTFAGILPGVLFAKRIITDTHETDVTVEAVNKAVEETLVKCAYPMDAPIIVLGGRGFVGRRLVKRLNGKEVHSIDLHNKNGFPSDLKGTKALLVNVSRKAAIKDYVHHFWKELVVLNEVYPPPDESELAMIKTVGCPLYHLVGVMAQAYPLFPSVYKGGIPCCAAWNAGEKLRVIIRRLA